MTRRWWRQMAARSSTRCRGRWNAVTDRLSNCSWNSESRGHGGPQSAAERDVGCRVGSQATCWWFMFAVGAEGCRLLLWPCREQRGQFVLCASWWSEHIVGASSAVRCSSGQHRSSFVWRWQSCHVAGYCLNIIIISSSSSSSSSSFLLHLLRQECSCSRVKAGKHFKITKEINKMKWNDFICVKIKLN